MSDILSELVGWIESLSPMLIYGTLLVIAFGENVLPPIPGDLVIVFAGYLVGLGRLDFMPAVVLASIGGVAGFMAMFAIGRRLGRSVLAPGRFRWLPKRRIAQGLDRVAEFGFLVVLVNRFLPGLRSVISLSSGMSAMSMWRTVLASLISAIAWSTLMVFAGQKLGENWEQVGVIMRRYSEVFLAVLAVIALLKYGLYRRAKASERRDQPEPS